VIGGQQHLAGDFDEGKGHKRKYRFGRGHADDCRGGAGPDGAFPILSQRGPTLCLRQLGERELPPLAVPIAEDLLAFDGPDRPVFCRQHRVDDSARSGKRIGENLANGRSRGGSGAAQQAFSRGKEHDPAGMGGHGVAGGRHRVGSNRAEIAVAQQVQTAIGEDPEIPPVIGAEGFDDFTRQFPRAVEALKMMAVETVEAGFGGYPKESRTVLDQAVDNRVVQTGPRVKDLKGVPLSRRKADEADKNR
jgi:hypothetical protein